MYFVDGNTADYGGEDFDLEGVKATFPPAEVPTEFNEARRHLGTKEGRTTPTAQSTTRSC